MEHRMEEARQQLNNIKSSWSEKITALENQIQNLNSKTAEDQVGSIAYGIVLLTSNLSLNFSSYGYDLVPSPVTYV